MYMTSSIPTFYKVKKSFFILHRKLYLTPFCQKSYFAILGLLLTSSDLIGQPCIICWILNRNQYSCKNIRFLELSTWRWSLKRKTFWLSNINYLEYTIKLCLSYQYLNFLIKNGSNKDIFFCWISIVLQMEASMDLDWKI